MAKKSKNSEQQVHYTRTMTPENLSRAANYVGEYVLKGLGALGKIFTAPLTGGPQGPATVVLPKTKKQLDTERKIRETQEQQIGKTMTWLSPLNYGVALAAGNGLDARKGEEEVASWSPAWQAAARLGELYVGPKAVKGVKATPRAVVNTAAKAGIKPARAAVVAREINRTTKQEPQITTENTVNMTPEQWTAAQDAAIARGDMIEAQRLRDLHFKINTPNNKIVDVEGNPVTMIHGSPAKFTEFRHKDNPFGTHGRGMYFGVAPKNLTTGYGGNNGYKYLTYLNGKSIYPDSGILIRDNAGKAIPNQIMYEIIGTNSYDEFINSVTRQFKDKFERDTFYDLKNIEKNIDRKTYQRLHDTFDTKLGGVPNIHKKKHLLRKDEKYATFNPQNAGELVVRDANQIKLADAVTYDDNGVRIPLGKRDNFNINDIRYGLIPFIGLGAFETLYRRQPQYQKQGDKIK